MTMKNGALAAMLVLAGCSGNPYLTDTGTGGGGTTTPGSTDVPAVVKGGLKGATYSEGVPTIAINLTAQDANGLIGTYARNTTYDVDGYQAFTYQETTSNRIVVALVKEAGAVKAITLVEGGQFGDYHYGADFSRPAVGYTQPAGGLGQSYDYSGTYAGLMNIGTPVPGPGVPDDLAPTRSYRTQGTALITADFSEMSVSGGVANRTIVDPLVPPITDPTLAPINLKTTAITADGTFAGKVTIGLTDVGNYAGLFGGTLAHDVAAVLVFNPYVGSSTIFEHGMIVLSNCASAGGPACP